MPLTLLRDNYANYLNMGTERTQNPLKHGMSKQNNKYENNVSFLVGKKKDFKIITPQSLCGRIHVIHSPPFSTLESLLSLRPQLILSNVAMQRGSPMLLKCFLSAIY